VVALQNMRSNGLVKKIKIFFVVFKKTPIFAAVICEKRLRLYFPSLGNEGGAGELRMNV